MKTVIASSVAQKALAAKSSIGDDIDEITELADRNNHKAAYALLTEKLRGWKEADIIKQMNKSPQYPVILFPSGFPWKKPYPAKLAAALVRSKAEESITDITNSYYGRGRNKRLEPAAEKVFTDFLLKNPKSIFTSFLGWISDSPKKFKTVDDLDDNAMNGWAEFSKAKPKVALKFLMLLPKNVVDLIRDGDFTNGPQGWELMQKQLGGGGKTAGKKAKIGSAK